MNKPRTNKSNNHPKLPQPLIIRDILPHSRLYQLGSLFTILFFPFLEIFFIRFQRSFLYRKLALHISLMYLRVTGIILPSTRYSSKRLHGSPSPFQTPHSAPFLPRTASLLGIRYLPFGNTPLQLHEDCPIDHPRQSE